MPFSTIDGKTMIKRNLIDNWLK